MHFWKKTFHKSKVIVVAIVVATVATPAANMTMITQLVLPVKELFSGKQPMSISISLVIY